ncbi:PAS domain-containing protein [Zavarzinia sp. CC-PAN008]|uniref:PAS domain-containing protein n=1 Tax=Zavarzinia sp. CC-PAN008 TaxID=3243332 RepID=UPI003F7468C7
MTGDLRGLADLPPVGFSHDPATVQSTMVGALSDWWFAQRGREAPVPQRANLSPKVLKPLLPNLLISEYVGDGRVRYRLVGTRVVELGRYDFTGMFLDDMAFNDALDWQAAYRAMRREPRPLYGTSAITLVDGSFVPYEFGMFPLSFDGRSVDQVVAVEDYGRVDLLTASMMKPIRPLRA